MRIWGQVYLGSLRSSIQGGWDGFGARSRDLGSSRMGAQRGGGLFSPQGDSGGPLVYQNGNVWTLIGIVSWGSSNCNIRTPAVYTRVSQFRNWIDNIVAQG